MCLRTNKSIEKLLATAIEELSNDEAVACVGELIDVAADTGSKRINDHAREALDRLLSRDLSSHQQALLHYFGANTWANQQAREAQNTSSWDLPESQHQILELRRAVRHTGFDDFDTIRQAQVLTNLANQLSMVGRFVEALELWGRALTIVPNLAIAH